MTSMHSVIPEEKLTEAYRLLLEMRDNCVKHADDQYDDPKRDAKYEALNIAITAMGRSIPPRWISVEERLPKEYAQVLVHVKHNETNELFSDWECIMTDVFLGDGWADNADSDMHVVTHWMPLPEPPKEATP